MTEQELIEKIDTGIVIVVDTSNYLASYSEEVPFKAEVEFVTDYPMLTVKSMSTSKVYELYPNQILECMSMVQIQNMINIKKYGEI